MQQTFIAEQQGHDHTTGSRNHQLSGAGHHTQQPGQQRSNLAGDADVITLIQVDGIHRRQHHGHTQKHEARQNHAILYRQHATDAAQQTQQSESAQAGDAIAFTRVALLPAALGADQQANRQCHGQMVKHRKVGIHQ